MSDILIPLDENGGEEQQNRQKVKKRKVWKTKHKHPASLFQKQKNNTQSESINPYFKSIRDEVVARYSTIRRPSDPQQAHIVDKIKKLKGPNTVAIREVLRDFFYEESPRVYGVAINDLIEVVSLRQNQIPDIVRKQFVYIRNYAVEHGLVKRILDDPQVPGSGLILYGFRFPNENPQFYEFEEIPSWHTHEGLLTRLYTRYQSRHLVALQPVQNLEKFMDSKEKAVSQASKLKSPTTKQ
jgi:hypothetical protein